jgi:TolB-like protein/Tfp pilus assembly protein PilF
MAFFSELKRRRVGKVAIAYGAIAWAVTEASSVVVPALHLPEWLVTAIVVFLLVGFPVAMVLAWIFDVGPQGIERTEPLAGEPASAHVRLRMAYAAVVLLLMGGLGYLLYERGFDRAHANEPHDSIAVLPFANLSGDAARDYFSDGMSEELLNLLARVPGLKVASRTSSFAYKGRNVDVRDVARELGVETVLEGSVRQASDRVRITAQLIDAETGFHLWSATYDRQLADIFQVQDEIAAAIVDKLRIELAPQEQALAIRDKAPTQNVEAYELYLQGRAIWKRRGDENLRRAIDLYQRAIGLDPAFARAHAALASAYVVLPGYTKEKGDEDTLLPMAETAARQALSLDPNIGEAHAVLAQVNAERGNLLDAEAGFFFAISLEANDATAHHWYSILLGRVGRVGQALEQARRAHELDPQSPIIASNLAANHLMAGNYDQALRYATLSEDLGLSKTNTGVRAAIAIRRGQWDEARRLMEQQEGMQPELRPLIGPFVAAVADPKLRPQAIADMRKIAPAVARQIELVGPYIELGAVDLAYDLMLAELERDPRAWLTHWDLTVAWGPNGAAFRADPRFAELAQRIGLLDYWKQYGFADGCRAGEETPVTCS